VPVVSTFHIDYIQNFLSLIKENWFCWIDFEQLLRK
jgi:hypothetical protein